MLVAGVTGLLTQADRHALAESSPCDRAAELFIETGATLVGNSGEVLLECCGDDGCQQFAFASGSSQANIVVAINTFVLSTGVQAEVSDENPQRVRVHSLLAGNDAFVSVTQISNRPPRIFSAPVGGKASWRMIAHGEDGLAGDSNCDGHVGLPDLLNVISNWGACPAQPAACIGDLDLNGVVNVGDLLAVIVNWGATH